MTTSRTSTAASMLSLVLALLVRTSSAVTPCHICGEVGNGAMMYPHVILANVEKTCNDISLEVALTPGLMPNTPQCAAKQQEWGARCCSGQRPAGRDPPPGLPPQNVPVIPHNGPYPVCNICRDGDYPYATSMVINFLYIGEGSCAQYYRYGKEGKIQTHMCDPVKFFSYEPCGCGEHNPYFNPNHPLNAQAQQAPGTNAGTPAASTTGTTAGQQPNQQRDPGVLGDDKSSEKIGGTSMGGAGAMGGLRRARRTLKGSSNKNANTEVAIVEA